MDKEDKKNIENILSSATNEKDMRIENVIIGDSNIVFGDNAKIQINTTPRTKTVKRTYSPGSIGYNGLLVINIKNLCNNILDARCKIKPKSEHSSISKRFNNDLNKHFGVKSRADLYNLPEKFATEIIDYLNKKI